MVIRLFAPTRTGLARSFVRRPKSTPRVGGSSPVSLLRVRSLSILFAFRRVLTGFFRFCGTLVHKRPKRALFWIAADNQRVTTGYFYAQSKGSVIGIRCADKFCIEKRQKRRGEPPKTTCSFHLHSTLNRPTQRGVSENTPCHVARFPSPQYKILSRFFRLPAAAEQAHKTIPMVLLLLTEKRLILSVRKSLKSWWTLSPRHRPG